MRAPIAERLEAYSIPEPNTGCRLWLMGVFPDGYGFMWANGGTRRVNRLAWELVHGPIPPGLLVCHKCDQPLCIESTHLFLGTVAENNADCVAKGREATGDRNGSRRHPECLARGDRNWTRMYPERVKRGEAHGRARLSEEQVKEIRSRCDAGESKTALAHVYGVSLPLIQKIHRRKLWRHVA